MKKYIIYTFLFCFFAPFSIAQKKIILHPPKVSTIKLENADSEFYGIDFKKIIYWYQNGYSNKKKDCNLGYAQSFSNAKKNYHIKNGLLYLKNKKVDSVEINYKKKDSIDYIVCIKNGYPIKHIVRIEGFSIPSPFYTLYDHGNIESIISPEYKNSFKNGSGYLKNYYYGEWNYGAMPEHYQNGGIKEEGEVKSNFKSGLWKYYNKSGIIDSTKTYTLKDSVDVRFPQCLFNKNEPCY